MNVVDPREPQAGWIRVVFGENQPEYVALPANRAFMGVDAMLGKVECEWEPTAEELQRLMEGKRVRLTIMTFNQPLSPVLIEVTE